MNFKIIEVELKSTPVEISLSSGLTLEITPQHEEGRAKVVFGGKVYYLEQVIDTSQTIEHSQVFVITSILHPDSVFLLGGCFAHQLHLNDGIVKSISIEKLAYLSEFAYWRLIETAMGLLCIFETGVLMLNQDFAIVWKTSINVLDHFDRIDAEKAWFKFDHDIEWCIHLKDGSVERIIK